MVRILWFFIRFLSVKKKSFPFAFKKSSNVVVSDEFSAERYYKIPHFGYRKGHFFCFYHFSFLIFIIIYCLLFTCFLFYIYCFYVVFFLSSLRATFFPFFIFHSFYFHFVFYPFVLVQVSYSHWSVPSSSPSLSCRGILVFALQQRNLAISRGI